MYSALKNILLNAVNCRDCWNKGIVLEKPFNPPRGWACNTDPAEVKIMVVSLNPGHPLPEEIKKFEGKQDYSLDHEDLQFLIDFATNVYRSTNSPYGGSSVFHKKLKSYIQEALISCNIIDRHEIDNWFKHVWLTDAFKCSTINETGPKIPAESMRYCIRKHLLKELEYFNPKAIIALGRRSYIELMKTKWANNTVYFRHPAVGGPRVEDPMFIKQLEELSRVYK